MTSIIDQKKSEKKPFKTEGFTSLKYSTEINQKTTQKSSAKTGAKRIVLSAKNTSKIGSAIVKKGAPIPSQNAINLPEKYKKQSVCSAVSAVSGSKKRPLVNTTMLPDTSEKDVKKQKDGYWRKFYLNRQLLDSIGLKRPAQCMRLPARGEGGVIKAPTLLLTESGSVRYGSVGCCESSKICVHCHHKKAAEDREKVLKALRLNREQGGISLFTTFTVSHTRDVKLVDSLASLKKCLAAFHADRRVKEIRRALGLKGDIRSTEIMLMGPNGDHPHEHALWLLEAPVCPHVVTQALHVLRAIWVRLTAKHGCTASYEAGFDIRVARSEDDEELASYVTKFAFELTSLESKKGRKESLTIWQVFDAYHSTGEVVYSNKVREYYNATKGYVFLRFSKGLKAALGFDEAMENEVEGGETGNKDSVVYSYTFEEKEWQIVNRCNIVPADFEPYIHDVKLIKAYIRIRS